MSLIPPQYPADVFPICSMDQLQIMTEPEKAAYLE